MLFQPLLWPLCESMFLVIRHYSSQKLKNLWNSNIITGWDWWSALLWDCSRHFKWMDFFFLTSNLDIQIRMTGCSSTVPSTMSQLSFYCHHVHIYIDTHTHTHTHMLSLTSNLETNLILSYITGDTLFFIFPIRSINKVLTHHIYFTAHQDSL